MSVGVCGKSSAQFSWHYFLHELKWNSEHIFTINYRCFDTFCRLNSHPSVVCSWNKLLSQFLFADKLGTYDQHQEQMSYIFSCDLVHILQSCVLFSICMLQGNLILYCDSSGRMFFSLFYVHVVSAVLQLSKECLFAHHTNAIIAPSFLYASL